MTVSEQIKQRGHWALTIRLFSTMFEPNRILYNDLYRILQQSQVKMLGWPFPTLDTQYTMFDDDFIEGELTTTDQDHAEAWRFFTSGQFLGIRGFVDDWPNYSDVGTRTLGYVGAIYSITEYCSFAAQLADVVQTDEPISIQILANQTGGRFLHNDAPQSMRLPNDKYRTNADNIELLNTVVDLPSLRTRYREIAADAVIQLAARFGLEVDQASIFKRQDRLRFPE